MAGAVEKFGLTDREVAVFCGSHFAESFHREAVASVLKKIGADIGALKSPAAPSIKSSIALAQARDRHELDAIDSNCSGKHAGMLAACTALGYPLDGYMESDHPIQRDIISLLKEICEPESGEIPVGEDGCGVPVHWLPLSAMARGFARLADPSSLRPELASACETVVRAMNAHPEMVEGTGGFCSALLAAAKGRLVAKNGAEGVFCVGIVGRGVGVAVKCDDGSSRAIPPTVIKILRELDAFGGDLPSELERYASPTVRNAHGHVVGNVMPIFDLER